jgi:Fe2+ transport system protein FeoA
VAGLGARRRVSAPGTLLELQPGERATVAGLEDPASAEGRALASLGVLPGVAVEVVQRYPAWIVRVDHAEIAFDDALAAGVRLVPGGTAA